MNERTDLDLLAEEILALETETFAISDYADLTEAVLASTSTSCSSTTSTTSATTSSTSCAA